MSLASPRFTKHSPYLVLYALVAAASFAVAADTRLFLNVDALSYISIAKLYANGEFGKAVNGHWSPLLSWLLVPFVWLKMDPTYWGKVIMGLGIIPSLEIVKRINEKNTVNPLLNFLVVATCAVVLFFPAMVNFTPDVLSIAPLLFVVYASLQRDSYNHTNDLTLGAIAALGYYTKHFALPFFVAFYSVVLVVKLLTNGGNQREVITHAVRTFAFFGLLVFPWVVCLSVKYNKVTFSTAASYNTSFLFNPNEAQRDYREQGLIDLPYPEAFSYWDDPALIKMQPFGWKEAFATEAARAFQAKRLGENANSLYDFLDFMLTGALLFILVAALLAIGWCIYKNNLRRLSIYLVLLLALLLYCTMYVLMVIDHRYLYFALVVLVMIAGFFLNDVVQLIKTSRRVFGIVGLVAAYWLSEVSLQKILEFKSDGQKKNNELSAIAEKLNRNAKHCNAFTHHVHTDLMYLTGLKYCGKLKKNVPLNYTANELRMHHIRYVTAVAPVPDSLLTLMKPVIENERGIWVYETSLGEN